MRISSITYHISYSHWLDYNCLQPSVWRQWNNFCLLLYMCVLSQDHQQREQPRPWPWRVLLIKQLLQLRKASLTVLRDWGEWFCSLFSGYKPLEKTFHWAILFYFIFFHWTILKFLSMDMSIHYWGEYPVVHHFWKDIRQHLQVSWQQGDQTSQS